MPSLKTAHTETIRDAATILKSGGLVAIPTETVYGLSANALDGKAIARVYEAKGRPSFNPLIVHCMNSEHAKTIASFNDTACQLAHHLWPGPLTLILPKANTCPVHELATAGLETIAVRVPGHPVAQDLLKICEFPLVAPSANKSGGLSPTTPTHVVQSLEDNVDMILAAGKTKIGLESTVLDLTSSQPIILRPGAITAECISDILNHTVPYHYETTNAPKSPGQTLRHYAPDTPLRLDAIDIGDHEALLAFGSIKFMSLKKGGAAKDLPQSRIRNLSETGDLNEAAANLFSMLKDLDHPDHTAIAVMNIPETGLGIAINDRLRRGAAS